MNRRLSILTALVAILALSGTALAAPISSAQATTLKPTAATLYVSTSGSDTNPCTKAAPCLTITYALGQAPSGATISVGPGTYREQVNITQPVRLVGSGAGVTTIDGTGVVLTDPAYGLVNISAVSGAVSFSRFTVQNAAIAPWLGTQPFDVAVDNGHATATVTLSSNVFQGTGDPADYVVGVYVQNSPAVTMNVTQNTFTDLYQAVFFENGGPATVSHNIFTALSTGDLASYPPAGVFVLVDNGSTVSQQTVSYNSFNNYAGIGVAFEAGYNGGADTGYITNSVINNNTFGLGPVDTNTYWAAAISLLGHDAAGTNPASTISGLKVTKNSGTVVSPTKAIYAYSNSVFYTATKNSITVL